MNKSAQVFFFFIIDQTDRERSANLRRGTMTTTAYLSANTKILSENALGTNEEALGRDASRDGGERAGKELRWKEQEKYIPYGRGRYVIARG